MYIFKKKQALENHLEKVRNSGQTIGYVPTMGALHEGHLSLLRLARQKTGQTVCSIFVNPPQFNDSSDFEKYPVQVDADIQKLLETDVDVLFLPDAGEIYPEGTQSLEHYDFGILEQLAEGAHRADHFQGVGQVLSRMLKIIDPKKMFMGQKDYQQWLITRKLVEILGLEVAVEACPILREPDGLAMSSRNVRLSQKARENAPFLYQTLCFVRDHLYEKPFPELQKEAIQKLEKQGFKVEYLFLTRADDLQKAEAVALGVPFVLLVAVWLDGVRLIDNLLLKES